MAWYWIVILTIVGCSLFGVLLYNLTQRNEEIQLFYSIGIFAPICVIINAIYQYHKDSGYRAKRKQLRKRM